MIVASCIDVPPEDRTRKHLRETTMTHVYFHCSTPDRMVLDPRGSEVEDLSEAREHAVRVVREFVSRRSADDWRAWTLHVADEDGEEIFVMPFACVLGRPH